MNIRYLLILTVLLSSGSSFGADEESGTQSSAPTASKGSLGAKVRTKPKNKAKFKAKTANKNSAKGQKPGKATADPRATTAPDADPAALAAATDLYKKVLAAEIVKASPAKVYGQRPQALLRSVVVLEFQVAADGKLLKSTVRRSNHDRATEATALASLREAAPLPKPPPILVRHGPIALQETWLFNKDGRFQIRSTAQPQLNR